MTAFLIGTWQFNRHITDRKANTTRTATGQLVVTANTWAESGVMDGVDFTQNYGVAFGGYNRGQDGQGLTVTFPDGRVFYELANINQNNTIAHLCGGDMYDGLWQYGGNAQFTLTWNVQGERKDYTMITDYSKKK